MYIYICIIYIRSKYVINASWNWCNLADGVSTGYTRRAAVAASRRSLSVASVTSRDDYTPKRIFGVANAVESRQRKREQSVQYCEGRVAERRAERFGVRPKTNSSCLRLLLHACTPFRRDEVARKKIQFLRAKRSSGGREVHVRTLPSSSSSSRLGLETISSGSIVAGLNNRKLGRVTFRVEKMHKRSGICQRLS